MSNKRVSELYKQVFLSPGGELVFQHMMLKYGFYSPTFHEDSNKMYFSEGQRNVILDIFKMLSIDETEARKIALAQSEEDDESVF